MCVENIYTLVDYSNQLYNSKNKYENFEIVSNFIFTYFAKIINNKVSTYLNNYIEINFNIRKDYYYNIKKYIDNLIYDDSLIVIKFSEIDNDKFKIVIKIDSNEFIQNNNMKQIIKILEIENISEFYNNKLNLYNKLIECYYKVIINNKEEIIKNIYINDTNIISNEYIKNNRKQFTKYAKVLNKDINIIDLI
jgi:hypothetical protein